MTSVIRGGDSTDKLRELDSDKEGRGIRNPKNFADVIKYGPLR